MITELRNVLSRAALAAVITVAMAVFFSAAFGLVDGNFVAGFGYRFRVTGAFLMLVSLLICLAWPRQSTTLRQNALRTLLDICVLSAIAGAFLYWLRQSVGDACSITSVILAAYLGVRLGFLEVDLSTKGGWDAASTWSVLRRRLVFGLLGATALGALGGWGGWFLSDAAGLSAAIRAGIALTVCAVFPGLVGKWVMEVAYREGEFLSTRGSNGTDGEDLNAAGESSNVAAELASEVSEDRSPLRRLAGRRAIRRGCIVGSVLVPALPAVAWTLTMSMKWAGAFAIMGYLFYWGEFWLCYWDWRKRP